MLDKIIFEIVEEIVKDICDRRGLKSEWRMIETDIQKEIKKAWFVIIKNKLIAHQFSNTCLSQKSSIRILISDIS